MRKYCNPNDQPKAYKQGFFLYFCSHNLKQMEQKENLLGMVRVVWSWRKPILLVCIAAVVGTAIISLFLANYYKAVTVFLATSPDQAKPDALYSSREYYGNANDVDRLLTIAESNELVSFLVDSFHLYEHYRINPENARASYLVQQKFFSLYEVKKNKREAIELTIEDRDRKLAANMANAAREKIDEIAQALIKEGQRKAIQTFENQIQVKQALLKTLSDTLISLRNTYGIFNTVAQTENLTQQQSEAQGRLILNRKRLEVLKATPGVPRDTISMLNALVQGLEEEVKGTGALIKDFNSGMAIVLIYEKQWFESNAQLTAEFERLKLWRSAYEASIPATVLVEKAEVPMVKSRPKRSILVLTAGAIAFIFSIFAVLLMDAYQENWRVTLQEVVTSDNGTVKPEKRKKKKKKHSKNVESEEAT